MSYYRHSVGNGFLTTLSNMSTSHILSDMETCYKVFRRELVQAITIEENRFGFEPEITGEDRADRGSRIFEIWISYSGRTYTEGKRTGWKGRFSAIYCIEKCNSFKDNKQKHGS